METIKVKNYGEIPNGFTGIVKYADGGKEWLLNGKRHRVDGPARVWSNGRKEWWLNGEHHRVDGPARVWSSGRKEWWLNDNHVFILEPIGEYLIIEDGLPSTMKWLGRRVTQRKILTAEGLMFIPNLPGI
jgi:hypothetical protein